ncbi:MAG: hypothetical protein JWN30_186 [Bacilli bacterium]|nr:hypothetical protein [Bacilli bacterium]
MLGSDFAIPKKGEELHLRKICSYFLVLALIVTVFVACSSPPPAVDTVSKDPVTLTVYTYFMNISDDEINQYLVQPLKEKYPNITLNFIRKGVPKDVVASDTIPDIAITSNSRFQEFQDLDFPLDLRDSIKKYNVDLNKFVPVNMETIKEKGTNGEIYGIPFVMNHQVIFYNKDVFDTLGVPYPKDGMTWDDVLALDKKLTRNVGGVQYIGMSPTNPETLARQLSLSYVDPTTNKALINNDQWKSILSLLQQFYQIPGFINGDKYSYSWDDFTKGRHVAMTLGWIIDQGTALQTLYQSDTTMNFDIVSFPSNKQKPGIGMDPGAQLLLVSKASQHKDAAFQVASFFASEQVQSILNKNGRLTILNNPDIKKDFDANLSVMQGKNLKGALSMTPAVPIKPTKYDAIVVNTMNGLSKELATGSKDINTILQDAQDAADKGIATAVAQN